MLYFAIKLDRNILSSPRLYGRKKIQAELSWLGQTGDYIDILRQTMDFINQKFKKKRNK